MEMVLAKFYSYTIILTFNILYLASSAFAEEITLENQQWLIKINSGSLQVTAEIKPGNSRIIISAPQNSLWSVQNLKQRGSEASWLIPEAGGTISFQLDGPDLSAHFLSQTAGSFVWPIINSQPSIRGYILPLSEGSYVPSDDARWLDFLVNRSPMNTTEGLSMPFWGLDCGEYTLTYILTNQFNNNLNFAEDQGKIALRFSHDFTRLWEKKEYGFLIHLGDPSPVEPARHYRQWLIQNGQFVRIQDKIKNVPNLEKLLGAAHIYLWGDGLISQYDVSDWKGFAANLKDSPVKRIWELMSPEAHKAIDEIVSIEYPYDYVKRQVADELSALLGRRDFYDEVSWRSIALSQEARNLLERGLSDLSDIEMWRLNCLLLEAAFPGQLVESSRWGNGVSVKMMEKFAENAFDRLWLGLDSWTGGYRHPQAIAKARELGYLIGPYDSYHSIHHPDEPDTWETAQFDLDLYETGTIVRADGVKRIGFNRKGYKLSPIAAKPYVERRVAGIMENMKDAGFNSWFIDCDAYGELYEDYSELHTATQEDDMNARLDRMSYIRDTYKLVIGSEGGAAYAAPVIHFAHGMMTPVIGWGDPDLREDKTSRYYLGAWYPPEGPKVFVKQVPLKEEYYHFYYDPRFRLPLYQIAFHDSVIATHQWGYGSLKFQDQADTVELLELLYNVPPLYHINLQEFEKHKDRMKAHYDFFSPLHRELGLLPVTDFAWLTPDRMVQRTVFGAQVEIVANFRTESFSYQDSIIPGRSIMVRWHNTGKTKIFSPHT